VNCNGAPGDEPGVRFRQACGPGLRKGSRPRLIQAQRRVEWRAGLTPALRHQILSLSQNSPARVAALGGGTLVLANRFGRREFDFRSTARIVIDQRNVAQALAVLTQVAAAIGRIHEVVQVGDTFGADQRQRYGGQAVVHRGAGEQDRNRYATIGGVER